MRRAWPLLPLAAGLALAYAFGLQRELSWTALASHDQALRVAVESRPFLTAAAFVAIYVTVVTCSIPGAVWLTVAGGAMFGTIIGAMLAVVSATSGGVLVFLAARSVLAGLFARHASSPVIERVRCRLHRDGFSYLLAIRLIPMVPFWLTDLAAAGSGMRLSHYVYATFIGIIPASTIFASIGAGFNTALTRGGRPDVSVILTPRVLIPLLALAALAMFPVGWRHWRSGSRKAVSNA